MRGYDQRAIAAYVAATLTQFAEYKKLRHPVHELKRRLAAKFPDVDFGGAFLDQTSSAQPWGIYAGPKSSGMRECITPDMLQP